MELLFTVQLVCTLMMCGLIWFVQIVHYPMFAVVGKDAFCSYERIHQRRTTWVVVPVMCLEMATAVGWMMLSRDSGTFPIAAIGLGLLLTTWLSTALLQVPCHRSLEREFSVAVHRRLVRTNWIRTAAWTARGLLLVIVGVGSS